MPNHHLIYIPGLHDQVPPKPWLGQVLPLFWRGRGFIGHIMAPRWEQGEFGPKLQVILDKIDELTAQGHTVSLVGQSAGSSLGLNAFAARLDHVVGLVILTGRLRVAGQPSLAQAAKTSPAFAESVRRAEITLSKLTASNLRRIMTIRPSTDKLVPATSVPISGATNRVSQLRGHSFGGAMMASFASAQWLSFLEQARLR